MAENSMTEKGTKRPPMSRLERIADISARLILVAFLVYWAVQLSDVIKVFIAANWEGI